MLDTDPSPHRRAWDLIPWLVAGVASAAERKLLQQHLPGCQACREEMQFQQQLHAAMQAATPQPGDAESGLQRLMARIDLAEPQPQAPPRTPAWPRWLAAAVVVQSVGLGAAGLALWDRQRDGDYRTLSSPAAMAQPATVRLVPAPGMDFATLRQLLAEHHLAVVEVAPDGTSLGLVAADGTPGTVQAALPALRRLPGVLLAEPTGHAARP